MLSLVLYKIDAYKAPAKKLAKSDSAIKADNSIIRLKPVLPTFRFGNFSACIIKDFFLFVVKHNPFLKVIFVAVRLNYADFIVE